LDNGISVPVIMQTGSGKYHQATDFRNLKAGKETEIDLNKTKSKAEEALTFCKSSKFNTDFCILIDMSLHSGVKRLVVWDFKTNSASKKYLVGHGCGNNQWSSDESKDHPSSAMKTEVIFHHLENTKFRDEVTATGEFM
jgi:hypothetical protein